MKNKSSSAPLQGLRGLALAASLMVLLPFAHATGSFTLSTNPTSVGLFCNFYGCDPGTANSNLTITSVNGFSGTVTLTYIAPNPSGGTSLTGPSSASVSAGGSTTVTITAHHGGGRSINAVWTINGQGGGFSTNTTLTIQYFYCKTTARIIAIEAW